MGVLGFIKRFVLFVTIWATVFVGICYVFPFHYFNQKVSEAYNLEKTSEIDRSQDLAVENKIFE
ncbi:hypothetical protein [Mesonia aestuariivivens]|uniref:Uncharacterized protein n=1 Tax=Mesonia aestuariivivens TaxID=2796128 RepID=A0ABS6VZL5_9FLAO|nr:hypothetical protein [Mesonia aestuariivivens]MBW2961027.1 hypothetical protein [Mesonia aestuariivivens]